MHPMKAVAKAILEKIAPRMLYERQLNRLKNAEPEVALLPDLCRRDAISLDVGANKGLYSYHMLPHSKAVIAFEPLPQMQKRLTTHFGDRITLHGVALSDHEGISQIRLPQGNPSWATIESHNTLSLAQVPTVSIAIQTRTLDGYHLDNIGFIKIDVEGHEEGVLQGGKETIRRNRPVVLVEVEERHNAGSIERVRQFLEGLGYQGFFFEGGKLNPIENFDLAKDQPIQNVDVTGKTGRYINNFIFTPR